MATLDELKAAKIQLFRQTAESEFWAAFVEHPDDVPVLAQEYVIMGSILGGALAVQQRSRLQNARAVVEKMRSKCDLVRAATTVSEVEAISWTA